MREIADWLEELGLGQYAQRLAENGIDLSVLRELTDEDLDGLGVLLGHRRKMLRAIAELNQAEATAGTARQHEAERRHLTVMICDLVGSTALTARLDPEDMGAVIDAYHAACARITLSYDGFLAEFRGDGILAYFGYPRAHEDDAERTVRAALDIITAVARLETRAGEPLSVRIGIATGIVVVGDRGGEGKLRDCAVIGDAPNLAARLQTLVEPNTIVVAESTRRLLGGLFEYEDLGAREVKGIGGPTKVYRVLGPSQAESRFDAATRRRLTPIVGREAEISILIESWRQVKETGTGRAVLLRGEAGIGKSRMVSELRMHLQNEPVSTKLVQCSPFFANSAFYPIRASFEGTMLPVRDKDGAAQLDTLETLLVDRLSIAREDMRFIAALLSLPFQERYGAILVSPKLAKEETMRVLIQLARAETRARPLLILFEDAHWADPTTLDALGRFVNVLPGTRTLLVVTARPEFAPPWTDYSAVTALDLAKFTPAQSTSLVSNVVGGRDLPPGLAARIVARTDGVPLFVEELTKTIVESGDLMLLDDRYAYAGSSAAVVIPERLRDSLMARLDKVAPSKEIAQVGSVIGREFSYELLVGLDLMHEEALRDGLRHLTSSGLASCQGELPNAVYTFSHALVQDAAYESLLKARRKQLHGQVADLIEERWPTTRDTAPELLALHHTAAERYQIAAPLWLRAGQAAIARFALPEALSHLRMGMSILSGIPPSQARDHMEMSLRTALGPTIVAQRGWGQAEVAEVLEPAWRLAQSSKQTIAYLPILNALSIHFMCVNRLADSLRWAEHLLQQGAELGDQNLEIVGHRAASACHYWLGEFEAARRAGDHVHRLYDPERHRGIVALTNIDPFTGEGIYRAQFLWMMGYPDQALEAYAATEANARRRGHPFDLAFALTLGSQVFDYLCDSDALLQRTEEAERIGREHGIPLLGEIMVEISRGVAWLRAGRLPDAVTQLDRGIERLMQTGHRIWVWYLKALQAEGLALMGELDGAWALIQESIARTEAGEERSHYAEVLRLKGWMLILRGQADQADLTLRKALAVARDHCAKSWELRAATTLARLLADRGKPQEALAALAPVCTWFTEGDHSRDLQVAARLLADLRAPAAAGTTSSAAASERLRLNPR